MDGDVIGIVDQMMLMYIPRNQKLEQYARSLVDIGNELALLAAAESHHQIRVIAFDHFL